MARKKDPSDMKMTSCNVALCKNIVQITISEACMHVILLMQLSLLLFRYIECRLT